jgi:hypothetical protein
MLERAQIQFRASTGWQGPETRHWERSRMPGERKLSGVLSDIEREARLLGAAAAVIETCHRDRHYRAYRSVLLSSALSLSHPGVVVYLSNRRQGPMRYACDAYAHWLDNLAAVVKTLEALRGIDRWGVATGGEQYRGWQQLPPATADPRRAAALVLLARGGYETSDANVTVLLGDPEQARRAYNRAAKATHPDANPDMDGSEFREVQRAWEAFGK